MSFASAFDREGFLIIPRLFDPRLIDALREEYEAQQRVARAAGRDSDYQVGDKRIQLAIALKGAFLDPLTWANPLLLPVVRSLLGPDVCLDSISLVVAQPGAGEQHRHRDHARLFPELDPGPVLPTHAVTVMVPLVDLDPATGTTMLNPGTHRGDPVGEVVPAFVNRGGCYLMHYDLQHWGSANRSNFDRPLLTMTYARPWFTDSLNFRHNPRLNLTPEDALTIAGEHRPLFRRLNPSPYPRAASHKVSSEAAA